MHVVLIILILFFVISVYMLFRNNQTYEFAIKLSEMAFAYNVRHIKDRINNSDNDDAFVWFSGKYSYERLLFSIKPLKLEYWFTEEELNKINN